MGVSNSFVWRSVFLRFVVRDFYVCGLVLISHVSLLVILTFGGYFSYD